MGIPSDAQFTIVVRWNDEEAAAAVMEFATCADPDDDRSDLGWSACYDIWVTRWEAGGAITPPIRVAAGVAADDPWRDATLAAYDLLWQEMADAYVAQQERRAEWR